MSGTAASLILDIDKSMISNILTVENVAYYSVAIFIAAVMSFPKRPCFRSSVHWWPRLWMIKMIWPVKIVEKSAKNLLLVSGLLFLLINLNLNDFYAWTNLGDYTVALEVVLIVSLGKLFTMSMGCWTTSLPIQNITPMFFGFRLALPFWPFYSTLSPSNGMGLLEQHMQH